MDEITEEEIQALNQMYLSIGKDKTRKELIVTAKEIKTIGHNPKHIVIDDLQGLSWKQRMKEYRKSV